MVNVFQKGPWFLYGFFLSVQRWIPNFVASKATQSYTAIWIRLPQLPTEFYDKEILQKVGSSIGRLLKVDACTSVALRGRYARLCVELPLNKPVTPFLFIDSHKQFILYEGDKLLCTSCGLLGHTKPQCHHPKSMQKQESPSKDLETPQTRNTKPEEIWHTVPFNRSKQRDPTKRTSKLPDISQDPGISVNIFEAKSGRDLRTEKFQKISDGQILRITISLSLNLNFEVSLNLWSKSSELKWIDLMVPALETLLFVKFSLKNELRSRSFKAQH
uniref:DUF4283 domain-containing protein n=2 Tax=Nicotiana TaxID=4085 RepID=A0A1S4BF94_TOBAC|nr:PREDICTED: uncharacterized protein LOC104211257 [Nicotiana sylvestris]XP_016487554.1 PREDICTED: uncharacterized protein LOC107807645 [Nicotiana tabacum]